MGLAAGTRIGVYEILATLGEGGMGAVYRAHDTRLKRDVAIKVLLPEVADDPERIARFEREAQILASLNHPNIGHIHGLERGDGSVALVLELVDGATLADRIARGPLPLDEALPIATQIAQALETAHEQGIIHRDLKPANIKVRDDGTVKVLDFGLAKALDRSSGPGGPGGSAGVYRSDLSASPTLTSPALMTGVGVLLGTAAYMSPEQAKGRPADRRSDIWAFGCVLYEMLTAKRAFAGDDVTDTIVAVLSKEPEWSLLPPTTPARVRTLVRRCLERDPKRRLDSALVARLELDSSSDEAAPPPAARETRRPTALLLAGAFAAGLAVAAAISRVAPASEVPRPVTRFSIRPPSGYGWSPTSPPAVTLDGGRLAVVAVDAAGRASLWVRSLDAAVAVPVTGTEGARLPFWSPDGTQIGFFAEGKVKVVPATGGTPRVLADAPEPGGGTWGGDNQILYRPDMRSQIMRIDARGGTPVAATVLGENGREMRHEFPGFLPDGQHFVFGVRRNPGPLVLAIAEVGAEGEQRRLDAPGARYLNAQVRGRYLLASSERTLVARPFDPVRLDVSGQAVPLATDVALMGNGALGFSASESVLAYEQGGRDNSAVSLTDARGQQVRVLLPAVRDRDFASPSMSRDGQRVALVVNGEIWVFDVARENRLRLSFDNKPQANVNPVWSPDGRQIVYASHPDGNRDTFKFASAAGNAPVRDVAAPTPSGFARPEDWSPDGRYVAYIVRDDKTRLDVWLLDVNAATPTATPLLAGPGSEQSARFSPDGRWIAYESDETGRVEVFVQSIPGGTARRQLSLEGGRFPRWSRDGLALFWIGPDGALLKSAVRPGAELEVSAPESLFDSKLQLGANGAYDVRPDGGFVIQTIEEQPFDEVNVIMNWPALVKQ